MKSIIIALSILMAISNNQEHLNKYDYDKAWEAVEKFISDGLPKSALEKVEEIHKMASTENNKPQFVKSIIYISRLAIITDEKGIETSIERLENIIKTNSNDVKEITASYLAELYQRYFDINRYEISQRSEMTSEKGADFRTWTTQNFLTTIESYYLMSLENQEKINIPINEYQVILNTYDKEAIVFRPTLYEVLADRAINFFNSNDGLLPQNESSFTISDKAYFGTSKEFVGMAIKTSDPSSSKFRILTIYQQVLQAQIKSGNKQALADYDLKRLEYVFVNTTIEGKKEVYQGSLKNLAEANQKNDYYTEIIYVLAGTMLGDEKDTMSNVKVMDICNGAIKKYPLSSGASKCASIVSNITKPSIQLYAEQVYASKNNMLLAVDYNNVTLLQLSVIKLDKTYEEINKLNDQQQVLDYLIKAKKVFTSSHTLQVSKTYKSQKAELHMPALPYGQYAVLVTASGTEKSEKIHQYTLCHVSDLTYTTYLADKNRHFFVNDRLTGKPLQNVNIQLFTQEYNPGNRSYVFNKAGEYKTDKDGKVSMPATENRNFKVVLTHKKDVLNLSSFHGNYEQYEQQENRFAEIFTDRAIYRPGQVVYFKTILLKNDKNQIPSILPNHKVNIILHDANYQEVAKQTLTSNTFGSVNGSFTLPLGKLNGNFSIECNSSDGVNGNKKYSCRRIQKTHIFCENG
ncbi:MAG: hypothetical protein IPO92_06720 [Saprospiraceae bacterium]|nr:hypothetical protein [Saprospiraceae bacterium]